MNALRSSLFGFVVFLVCFLPAGLAAQQSGRTCQYDLECPATYSCNEQGQCVQRGYIEQAPADDECGQDRRCRIDRLKRRNQARRHQQIIEEERQVQRLLDRREEERLDDSPRLKSPVVADLRVSRLGPLGVHAGYTLFGHLQPELSLGYSSLNVFTSGTTSLSGDFSGWWFEFGASYFLLENWFSPYLSAGFLLMNGEFDSFSGGFVVDFARPRAIFHAGAVGGGIDLQLGFGLNTRLGMVYRPLIYNQARIGPGQYDPQTRQGLADWFNQAARIDVIWLLGWAF